MKKIGFIVEGMKCGGCKGKIEKAFAANSQVLNIEINLEEKSVIFNCEDEASTIELKGLIEEQGFSVPKSLRV
ncbi:heavy-metal-associated domain-containing protein [Halobacteriovorax sp. JY17]|uniref:heavy-metal-associated domain-containing protein n=1 Tax=Halobacteriovorax sp. JY17 TaxID=2014617 RepID=UPI000C68D89A|nr:heavy-metal-associated domain-containing protein [Halobacteriovorax sp. JY17]PIK13664.1 MAG: heavy metal transport/detoxification protein [Halobacteriovorax sp. JY17]